MEQRLTECKIDMAKAEQTLADYQALHKAAVISPGQSSATEAAARIYAQRTALQVRLGIVRGYAREGSQEVQQIVDQLAQLDIRALPETGLELARLVREVQKQERSTLLTAQYEEARIDEARDVVTVDVPDPPQPPSAVPSSPAARHHRRLPPQLRPRHGVRVVPGGEAARSPGPSAVTAGVGHAGAGARRGRPARGDRLPQRARERRGSWRLGGAVASSRRSR